MLRQQHEMLATVRSGIHSHFQPQRKSHP
jgi:hypothetical protein